MANAQYPLGQFRCDQFACHLVLFGRAFGLPIKAASHVEKALRTDVAVSCFDVETPITIPTGL